MSRGYEVPRGFCITTAALSAGAHLYEEPVVEALRQLESPWVARSSSTAEDSQGHAFPGLFTTLLDLADAGSLLDAVEKIQISTHSEVVRTYAKRVGVDPDAVRMAILVQSLVPATVAGVAFSCDPVTEVQHVVIEANYGLGETVVDGSVTPDGFTVSAAGEILKRSVGSKRQKVVATTRGARVRRVDTSDLERAALCLSDQDAVEVAEVTRKLNADLGYAVDIEWAFVNGRLHLLQARPITTVKGEGAGEEVKAG
jgi:pyruvate,water dikinase